MHILKDDKSDTFCSVSHTVISDENSRGQEINGQLHDTNSGLER